MAATKKPTREQQERTRAAIQTTQLIKRLQTFALSKVDDDTTVIDAPRLKAIEILLRKSLPDLQTVAITGADGDAIKTKIEYVITRAE